VCNLKHRSGGVHSFLSIEGDLQAATRTVVTRRVRGGLACLSLFVSELFCLSLSLSLSLSLFFFPLSLFLSDRLGWTIKGLAGYAVFIHFC
jgi:hypothetical protein